MLEANTALLDILVHNSVIMPSFQNPTKSLYLLNYSPECPEVADFAVFSLKHS